MKKTIDDLFFKFLQENAKYFNTHNIKIGYYPSDDFGKITLDILIIESDLRYKSAATSYYFTY